MTNEEMQELARLREEHRELRGVRKVGQRLFVVKDEDGLQLHDGAVRGSVAKSIAAVYEGTEKARRYARGQMGWASPCTLVAVGIEWRS